MTSFSSILSKSALTACTLFLVIGCGGGGEGDATTTTTTSGEVSTATTPTAVAGLDGSAVGLDDGQAQEKWSCQKIRNTYEAARPGSGAAFYWFTRYQARGCL